MYMKFVEKLKEPMILLLLASAFVSVCTGMYDDAISISLAVIIVISVAVIQVSFASVPNIARRNAHVCTVVQCNVLQL
jgi:Ca2+-transporting ATPase